MRYTRSRFESITDNLILALPFGYIAFWVAVFAGWLTHVIVCLKMGSWGFLIAGAFFFPIGIVHGWCIWLGIV